MTAKPRWATGVLLAAGAVALVGALVVALALAVRAGPAPRQEATAWVPFDANSVLRTPVPAESHVDVASPAVTARLVADGRVYASLVEFGIPIYTAEADTPRYRVSCLRLQWGPCPFDDTGTPIPDGARPHSGSDGAMVVVDEEAQLSYEFWQAQPVGSRWTTSFGAINPLNGSGWGGAATGAGASRLAGVVRLFEIQDGQIDHALALQSNNACVGVFRAPAVKTDGRSDRADCVPEGSRLRLDPAIDVESLDLPPAQLTVARAFQRYGGFVVDVGGAPLSISFELAADAEGTYPGEVYQSAGLTWDYDGLDGIPWQGLQMLAEEER